ncbi:hypothetical protein [uncultured Gammaproteobacteria bacterium]|nr:hypothetical protein [uncultured Gammaproteobacteria bacterium]CAC9953173.1 hypothetical protein [uncultured Gammaproteobacteria bacterium]CAC9969669.1 hypothetical protein [uncultured Gammaproteobacteria bacterium]
MCFFALLLYKGAGLSAEQDDRLPYGNNRNKIRKVFCLNGKVLI